MSCAPRSLARISLAARFMICALLVATRDRAFFSAFSKCRSTRCLTSSGTRHVSSAVAASQVRPLSPKPHCRSIARAIPYHTIPVLTCYRDCQRVLRNVELNENHCLSCLSYPAGKCMHSLREANPPSFRGRSA